MTATAKDYDNETEPAWCPGCGNFAILKAVKNALANLTLPPEKIVICSGIGQAPKLPHYLKCNCLNGLHGREIAAATGVKLAAPDMAVLVHSGDGGALGEGLNHLLSAMRRNIGITVVVHDNRVYGLTKGQASPTAEEGTKTALQPDGLAERPLNHLALAVSQDCSFVGQGTSANEEHLTDLLVQAMKNDGFSLVNVLQPCTTWDKVHTFKYYKEHCRELPQEHNSFDKMEALELLLTPRRIIPIGIIYRNPKSPYEKKTPLGGWKPLREHPVNPAMAKHFFKELE